MSVTLDVLKLDISNDINKEHPRNIKSIFVTNDVSKFDTSKDINEEGHSIINI